MFKRTSLAFTKLKRPMFFKNTRKYPIVMKCINRTFDTELWSELCASSG